MTAKIKALVVDDEKLARTGLIHMLASHTDIDIVGEASNVDEALAQIDRLKPTLLFLDIEMPEKTGFDLLEELIEVPHVVFTTAYNEFAIKAFEVNALDYLLKPITDTRLSEALQRVRKAIQIHESSVGDKLDIQSQVFIRDGEKCWFVRLADIRLIESVGNYARLHFDKFHPLIHKTLNALDERLSEKHFFRANRQQIINLNYIDRMEPFFNSGFLIYLKDGTKIEVSRRQAVKFKEMMAL